MENAITSTGNDEITLEDELSDLALGFNVFGEKLKALASKAEANGDLVTAGVYRQLAGDLVPLLVDSVQISGAAFGEIYDVLEGEEGEGEEGAVDGDEDDVEDDKVVLERKELDGHYRAFRMMVAFLNRGKKVRLFGSKAETLVFLDRLQRLLAGAVEVGNQRGFVEDEGDAKIREELDKLR
jgi:hypothetical protein